MTDTRTFPDDVDPRFGDHFAGLRERRLVIRQCTTCGTRQWPPRPLCAHCHALEFAAVEIGGEATVYTYSVVHRAFDPYFASRVPYGLVVGDLGDGIRMLGNTFGDVDRLACGIRIRAGFMDAGDHAFLTWIPEVA